MPNFRPEIRKIFFLKMVKKSFTSLKNVNSIRSPTYKFNVFVISKPCHQQLQMHEWFIPLQRICVFAHCSTIKFHNANCQKNLTEYENDYDFTITCLESLWMNEKCELFEHVICHVALNWAIKKIFLTCYVNNKK